MIRALHTSACGMQAQSTQVDNTANNLANVNTTAFKRNTVAFQDLIYQTLRSPGQEVLQGVNVPGGLQLGNGVLVAGNNKSFTAGTQTNTGNPLDITIDGQGFFQVTYPDGTLRYTRDGGLQLNSNGQLVTVDGFQISPALTVPNDTLQVAVGSDGTVSVIRAGAPTTSSVIGQLNVARFPNPAGLIAEGRNLYRESPASGSPVTGTPGQNGNGLLRQGFLEGSNVEAVTELVNLLLAQRAFEYNSRALRVADEMLSDTNQLVR